MTYFNNGRAPRSSFYRNTHEDSPQGFKPKSEETKHRERVELAYERRSNRCTTCHMTRSLAGECEC
jgi:hypothetical protein